MTFLKYILPLLLLRSASPLVAQSENNPIVFFKKTHLSIRAGWLYSMVNLENRLGANLKGILPRSGYYAGSFYQKDWSPWLATRMDVAFQMKGMNGVDRAGKPVSSNQYHYLGVSPSLGLKPSALIRQLKGLTFYIGPEANLLIIHKSTFGFGTPVEFGLTGRISYSWKQFGLEVSHFKALTKYDRAHLYGPYVDFYNYNWQAGLTYRLTNE